MPQCPIAGDAAGFDSVLERIYVEYCVFVAYKRCDETNFTTFFPGIAVE